MKYILPILIALTPVTSFGQTLGPNATLATVIDFILSYFNKAIVLLISLCVVMLVYGIVKYFFIKGDSSDSRKEGGLFVMYAIIALFVIFSFWGLVRILQNTFGLSNVALTAPVIGGFTGAGGASGTFTGGAGNPNSSTGSAGNPNPSQSPLF